METDEPPKPKRIHFIAVMFLSFLIIVVGMVIEQSIRWTNHFEGMVSGLFQGVVIGVAFCVIYVLPWSAIIMVIYRFGRFKRFRTQWMLAPSIVLALLLISSLITNPPNPFIRFKNFTKTELPSNAQDLEYRFSGGGLADYFDTYYFKTTPAEVDRLIANLGLHEDNYYGQNDMTHTIIKSLPGCPDFKSWEGARQYKGMDERQHWFYHIITDSTRTHVYIVVGCI